MTNLKLSIITINLNNSNGLLETIKSVINQSFNNFEYIIIDGGSTDKSIDVINKYKNNINKWISKKDNGIYSAMNTGIKLSKGEYCLFLNSGDKFVNSNSLNEVFYKKNTQDIIYCNIYYDKIPKFLPSNLSLKFFINNSIFHPSTFIKRILFSKIGLFNENLKFVSDWEFFLKSIIISNCSYLHINKEIVYFDTNGISSNIDNFKNIAKERSIILNKYFPRIYEDYIEYYEILGELKNYKASYLIKKVIQLQKSKLYKIIIYKK